MGPAFGRTSPVACYSPTLYLEARLPAGAVFTLPAEHEERALYVVSGEIDVHGDAGAGRYGPGLMLVARPGVPLTLTACEATRLAVIGGAPVGERHIWWNFVSSSKSRIEQAKADWRAMRFGTVPGDDEFIPLPG
jgi:redox-sensitive bicupin YhaK (pirin superfamily)